LLSEGKSVYKTDENITITGVLTDELGNLLSNKPIKIYLERLMDSLSFIFIRKESKYVSKF